MGSPYLVQRAAFKSRDTAHGAGIDRLLRFDYMGSAEFEFGALPNSLRVIREKIGEYVYLPLEIKGKRFTVFCREVDSDQVIRHVKGLADNLYHLKEWCDLHRYVANDTFLKSRNDHWWDIENHWMVWKENKEFTADFKIAIQPNA